MRALGNGMVPIYEEHTARLERGLSIETWSGMSEMEKAMLIAQRRISIQVQNLQTEAEIRKSKQDAKRKQ